MISQNVDQELLSMMDPLTRAVLCARESLPLFKPHEMSDLLETFNDLYDDQPEANRWFSPALEIAVRLPSFLKVLEAHYAGSLRVTLQEAGGDPAGMPLSDISRQLLDLSDTQARQTPTEHSVLLNRVRLAEKLFIAAFDY